MKTTLSYLAVFFLTINVSMATVRTVSNDPAGGAQYPGLQEAYNAASPGDTLLLEGTGLAYGLFVGCGTRWSKSLTVIGIGYNPQKQNVRKTYIANASCETWFTITNGGNGSRFYGIEFLSNTGTNGGNSILCENNPSNYTFENCKFYGHFGFNNWNVSNFTFRNCIWDQDNGNNLQLANNNAPVISNILISNCIFDGYITGSNNLFTTLIVDHCLFLGPNAFNTLYNATIMNSVFMNIFPIGTTNSNFINNICRVAGTFPPSGGNTGSGNLNATDPNFLTYTNGQFYSASHDYHLQPGSPAIGAGSETPPTDLGLHGGFTRFNESGEVLINPIMRSVIINNPTVAPNGTLNVNINASKPSDN